MGLDRERMLAKISYIKEQITEIDNLLQKSKKEEILSNPWLVKGYKIRQDPFRPARPGRRARIPGAFS
ncbi:MAG: hypothetical protein ACPLQO_07275 [Desulfotomaculales bacterium]